MPRVLIIDVDTPLLEGLSNLLRLEGFEVVTASEVTKGVELISDMNPDVVLADILTPGVGDVGILEAARTIDPEVRVILMTAQPTLRSAIQAVDQGAFHYLLKPVGSDELVTACRRAADAKRTRKPNREPGSRIGRRDRDETSRPTGSSRAFVEVLRLAETAAPTDSTLLISGESGTGKEVVARHVHALSARSGGPFVPVNCGALPENLLESELFGHLRGAFTGAVRDRDGLFVAARGGTVFLDEVGETSPAVQVRLLRVLQERQVVPVGSTRPIPVDVRIIAATNRDLGDEIRRGRFRGDLYYRLDVISVHLPPLRDRIEDVPLLAAHFLRRFAARQGRNAPRLSAEALAILQSYPWPGNARELENALERAYVLSNGEIRPEALPPRITAPPMQPLISNRLPLNPSLEIIERAYIRWVLQAEGGNRTRTAEVLGIDPSTLFRKLARYGIQP